MTNNNTVRKTIKNCTAELTLFVRGEIPVAVSFKKLGKLIREIEEVGKSINEGTKPILESLLNDVIAVCRTISDNGATSQDVRDEMKLKALEFDDMLTGLNVLKTTPVEEETVEKSAEPSVSNVVDPEVLVAARMAEKDRQIEILMNTAQELDIKNQDLEQRLIAANADASAVVNQARQSVTELRQELEASNRERDRLTKVINSMTPTDFVDQHDDHAFDPD